MIKKKKKQTERFWTSTGKMEDVNLNTITPVEHCLPLLGCPSMQQYVCSFTSWDRYIWWSFEQRYYHEGALEVVKLRRHEYWWYHVRRSVTTSGWAKQRVTVCVYDVSSMLFVIHFESSIHQICFPCSSDNSRTPFKTNTSARHKYITW